ncbi:MAG: L,D-transpeptidase family protein [Akkermansiaceae bacterium]
MKHLLLALLFTSLFASFSQAQVPDNCQQAIVGVSSGWNASEITLYLYEKNDRAWQLVSQPWKGRIGKKGLAWGKGLQPVAKTEAIRKVEGDMRAPAGIFKIGGAYGYASEIKRSALLPYRKISTRDLWVEDQNSPHYNRHMILGHEPASTWEKKAQMRQGDHAHSLKLYIAHNDSLLGGKATPGRGSAIFFHIWRGGGSKATAGCTTMPEDQLKKLIAQIDPSKNPVYILLPQSEYKQYRSAWKLP